MAFCLYRTELAALQRLQFPFFHFWGAEGIGKTTAICNYVASCNQLCDWDYLFISSKFQLEIEPLSAIAIAVGEAASDTTYFSLYKCICLRRKVILHIENPHLLSSDAQRLLNSIFCFLLNAGSEYSCKVIIESDLLHAPQSNVFSSATPENAYTKKLGLDDDDLFISVLEDKGIIFPKSVVDRFISLSCRNFNTCNEILLYLLSQEIAVRDLNGLLDLSQVTVAHLEAYSQFRINSMVATLADEQYHVITTAAAMGEHVYTYLLKNALSINKADDILTKIHDETRLVYLAQTASIFASIAPDSTDYIFSHSAYDYIARKIAVAEKYNIRRQLAEYLDVMLNSNALNISITAAHHTLASYFYKEIDSVKENEHAINAASLYKANGYSGIAAQMYWDCYARSTVESLYAVEAFKCWIDSESFTIIIEKFKASPLLWKCKWGAYYCCEAFYSIGDVEGCLSLLKATEKLRSEDRNIDFYIHSLYASVYDWINNSKLRKRHFLTAQKMLCQMDENWREDAKCALWKKCTMLLSFDLQQTKNKMQYAYNSYFRRGKLYNYCECSLNIGNEYLFDGDFENSYKYLMRAYDGFMTLKSRQIYIANNSLGMYFMLNGQYSNALQHFERINLGTIEPFCKYTVMLNKVNALLHLDSIGTACELLSVLDKNVDSLESQEMTIVSVHYHLAKAFYYMKCNAPAMSCNEVTKATQLCNPANGNFIILYEVCSLLASKWGFTTSGDRKYLLVSQLCCQLEITIGDIMCWR